MKRLITALLLVTGLSLSAHAQYSQAKVKSTSSPTQKVHNTLSKHKKHNGYKAKTEMNGTKHKHKVNTETGRAMDKTDKDK